MHDQNLEPQRPSAGWLTPILSYLALLQVYRYLYLYVSFCHVTVNIMAFFLLTRINAFRFVSRLNRFCIIIKLRNKMYRVIAKCLCAEITNNK